MAATKNWTDQDDLTSQGIDWAALTPSDTVDFVFIPKAIQVSSATGGQFVAVSEDDSEATFYGVPGQFLPIRPKRINATGMTAGMTFVGLKK